MEDVKEELSSYLQDKKLLKDKEEDLEELITKATKITTELSDMPKRNSRSARQNGRIRDKDSRIKK